MASAKIFRINYKSDFILTLESDAGWMTPFCIKFWTGAPSQAYYVSWDGETYDHCSFDPSEPTKLQVQFDDHHLPIGNLKYQIAYHFTVADFPNDTEDEVLNSANITTEIDGETYQVMLDFNGETAPEIQFSLPSYANEAQRIENEQQRIVAETQRIANEETRIANEQTRINHEQTRQQNEQQRINQEQARVNEYAGLKADAVAATGAANDAAALANQKAQLAADKAALAESAATLANQKAQLAADKAALANSAATLANQKAALAQQKAEYAQTQGDYAKTQGDYAKEQGDTALADHQRAETDHGIAVDDHTQAGNDHTRAESDHGIAADDHTQAGNDHTRAESDHGIAVDDHTQAGNDHTRAESDHRIAADDHTQAGNDHTRAESDHTLAESDHDAVELYVDSLGVFDLSKHNAVDGVLATYADLSAALTALNALESKYKYGGMSFKFVRTYDNKYVQYRLMSTDWSTVEDDWQGIDDKPIAGSESSVKSGGVEQCNYDITARLANIEESINGESNEKELIFEDDIISQLEQTEILLPISTPIGNIGTQYVVTISGNVKFAKFHIAIASDSLFLTDIDKSLSGKILNGVNRVKLVLKSSIDANCNLRILCYDGQPAGRTIHIKLERFTASDNVTLKQLKQYGTDKLLDLLHFEEYKVINTVNNNVSLTPSSTTSNVECCVIKCKEGNEFIINGTGYSNARLWAFADIHGNILIRSESDVKAVKTMITAPGGSAYLIINKKIDNCVCYTKQVSRLINNISNKHEVKLDSFTEYPYYIPAREAPYTWVSGGNRSYVIIPVKEGEIITLNPEEEFSNAYLFASSFEPVVEDASIANIGDKVIISENTTVKVPEGANFICVSYRNVHNKIIVGSIIVEDKKIIFDTIKESEQKFKKYVDEGFSKITPIDLSSITKYAFWVSENAAPYTWSYGNNRRSVVIPVQPGNILAIEPIDGMSSAYMFLSNFTEPITAGDSVYNVGDKIRIDKSVLIEVPNMASYLYILYINTSGQRTINSIYINKDEVLKLSLNEAKEYVDEKNTQLIKDLPNYVQQTGFNVQDLNQKTYGFQDVIGSWWFYPNVVSDISYRKKLFFGFIDKEGFSGVAELNCDSKQPMLIKNRLKHEYPDTHDSVSVTVLDDGRLLAIFPDGHNTGKYINIRVSKNKYSIDEFEAPIRIKSDDYVAYSQVHKVNGKYYVFFRSPIKYWRYIESEDLVNWTSPKIFIHDSADFQRYLLLKPITNESNKLRFATYSNPSYDDTNIRCGYIDFETNKVYDSTGIEVGIFGGDTPIETDDLTILVTQPESPYKNRLFDLAVTPLNIYRLTYAYFDNSSNSDGSDTVYYLYDNGTIKTICNGGQAYWIPKAQNGVQFLSDTKMVVGRSDVSSTGYDYIDIYDLVDGNVTFVKELYKELKTGLHKNRNGYVLADINGIYVIWFRGYYTSYGSSSTYMKYDYDTDVMIYDVVNDKLFGGDY